MVDLKLDFDEGILLQASYCGRYGSSEIELDEIYLTNKNLICIYEKSNGMFSKSETITENIPLESIKVINGNVQVMEVDNDEYDLGLQILFKNGTRELFVFDNPKKELSKWKNAIVATINGEPIPTEEKSPKKEKVAAFAGATAFASKIKSAVDSTKQTFSDISQQVKETATSTFDTEKPEVVEEKAEPISDEAKYIYCSNCGEKLISTAKFCQSCGAKVGTVIAEQKTSQKENVEKNPVDSPKEPIEPKADDEPIIKVTQEEYTERKTVYEGKIHKCPNCGEVLNAFTSNCPSCGYELRGTFGNSSVRELAAKLEAIESKRENVKSNAIKSLYFGKSMTKTDEQKISLIRSFPIPNTKEDLYEFLVLSQSNIDIGLYEEGNQFKLNSARGALSEAWKAKFEQAYHKAKLVFANDPRMKEIQQLYDSTQKTIRKAKTKTWKLLGIIWAIVIGFLAIMFILIFSLTANSEKKEISRLEGIVEQIEISLDNEDYKLALMNADSLNYNGTDSGSEKDWEIKREYWIDKVIEEAAENGVVLERPKEKEEPAESNANNSTESTNKENNTTVTESGSFDEKAVIKQLKVTEHCRNEYEHYFPITIIENPTEYNLSLSVDVKFYNKSGKLVGAESDEVYAFEKGTKTIMQFSVDEEFERMEYEFSVKEENYYNCVISSLKYESTSAKDKEILSVTNTGSIPAEFVEGYALFFKDGKLVGTDWTYFTDDDSELKPGKTITEELTSYGDEYDSVEFYFTGRGEKE